MSPVFVAFRRSLPGGAVVMISLEESETGVRGIMQVERRTEAARRLGHVPPTIVEVAGESQADVLAQLRAIAEHDEELAKRIAEWQARRPTGPSRAEREAREARDAAPREAEGREAPSPREPRDEQRREA